MMFNYSSTGDITVGGVVEWFVLTAHKEPPWSVASLHAPVMTATHRYSDQSKP